MTHIGEIMRMAPVIPVLVIQDPAHAGPIATALVAGGLPVLEVTLRTAAALEVIAEMAKVEGAVVGAGTVLNAAHVSDSHAAGARFLVSPGLTGPVATAAKDAGLPFLPGVANAGDIMRGLDLGLDHFKFFPAMAAGGPPALKALTGPFGDARFCPTGGVTLANAPQWFETPGVLCVGGTWLVGPGEPDLGAIEAAARQAAMLKAR